MKNTFRRLRATALAAMGAASLASQAAIVLTNGSFEAIGSQYSAGMYQATGWTNLSGLNIQASSAVKGFENTNAAGATGDRILRLASDVTDTNIGFIAQDMGTMVAGEVYRILGDVLGGFDGHLPWAATFRLASGMQVDPAVVFASQHIGGITLGQVGAGLIDLTYEAKSADDGKHLFMWMRADGSPPGTARRGGVDNLRLTVTPVPPPVSVPEPASLALVGVALAAAMRPRRRA